MSSRPFSPHEQLTLSLLGAGEPPQLTPQHIFGRDWDTIEVLPRDGLFLAANQRSGGSEYLIYGPSTDERNLNFVFQNELWILPAVPGLLRSNDGEVARVQLQGRHLVDLWRVDFGRWIGGEQDAARPHQVIRTDDGVIYLLGGTWLMALEDGGG